jgi:hypothetical protein
MATLLKRFGLPLLVLLLAAAPAAAKIPTATSASACPPRPSLSAGRLLMG